MIIINNLILYYALLEFNIKGTIEIRKRKIEILTVVG